MRSSTRAASACSGSAVSAPRFDETVERQRNGDAASDDIAYA